MKNSFSTIDYFLVCCIAIYLLINGAFAEEIKGVNPPPKDEVVITKPVVKLPLIHSDNAADLFVNVKDYGVVGDGKADGTVLIPKYESKACG